MKNSVKILVVLLITFSILFLVWHFYLSNALLFYSGVYSPNLDNESVTVTGLQGFEIQVYFYNYPDALPPSVIEFDIKNKLNSTVEFRKFVIYIPELGINRSFVYEINFTQVIENYRKLNPSGNVSDLMQRSFIGQALDSNDTIGMSYQFVQPQNPGTGYTANVEIIYNLVEKDKNNYIIRGIEQSSRGIIKGRVLQPPYY